MKNSSPDKPQFGLCVMYPVPAIVERIGGDWDWIWLDGQHGQISGYDQMLGMVRACNFVRTPAFVRVPGHEAAAISLALDMGADAVIVPQVDTVEQALAVIRAAKFPPLGNRSYGGRRPIDLHGRGYAASANAATKLICQIESPDAVANSASLAACEGVDGLFFGPDDFMLRRGFAMDGPGDRGVLAEAMRTVATACRTNGKICLSVGAGAEMTRLCVEAGVTHIVGGGDAGFIAGGSKSALDASRGALESLPGTAPSGKSAIY